MSAEKSFRIQTVIELATHTLPLLIVISVYSNSGEWTGLGRFTVLILVLMLVKNLAILTRYITQKFIEDFSDPDMRPNTGLTKMSKVEMEAVNHIKSYLIDPHDDGMD